MLRLRLKRTLVIVAVAFTVLLWTLKRNGDWPSYEQTKGLDLGLGQGVKEGERIAIPEAKATTPPPASEEMKEKEKDQLKAAPTTKPTKVESKPASPLAAVPNQQTKPAPAESVPQIVLPDRKPISPTKIIDDDGEDDIHPVAPPGRQELPADLPAEPTIIHWERQVEHFPVPKESLIHLPTGAPIQIPRIQHQFNDETPDAKINRQKRQDNVREEFRRAWNGYKTKAWMHDELSPVSGKFRDPFCGWAATLVDTLDTLWIMGLREDFEEAAKAVDLIDFTTSPRADIPVFETTIRYLGGLLAAYDVSGAAYKNLLDKAIELAEILMGIFDTPNRMPDLYYRWKPTFASQPHRAGQRSNLAELGSLSLEFTRLAQITKEPRYYDAIARITIALSDWQDRGTMLDGVFPDNVDASGCNRTQVEELLPHTSGREQAVFPAKPSEEPVGFQPVVPDMEPSRSTTKTKALAPGPGILEMDVLPGVPGKAEIKGWDDKNKLMKRAPLDLPDGLTGTNMTAQSVPSPKPTTDPITGLPLDIPAAQAAIGAGVGGWDCVPQGLEPASPHGTNKFSMGGGQDSTYEYFPKQYLLLGGLDDTYQKMYLKTVAAIRKYMLYRPMTKDDRDILFSGSVTVSGHPTTDDDIKLSADVEHLTCFVGGMIGMSAKIFGIADDLEIAKKLTDGCVWAYESFPSGIMPEGATVIPCKSAESCHWNETAYYEFLDPVGAVSRDKQIADYYTKKELRQQEEEAELAREAEVAENLRIAAIDAQETLAEVDARNPDFTAPVAGDPADDYDNTDPDGRSGSLNKQDTVSLQKRQVPPDTPTNVKKAVALSDITLSDEEKSFEQKSKQTALELQSVTASGRASEKPAPTKTSKAENLPDPWKPASHKEYVLSKIKEQSLPPSFASIKSRKYILRPEAIESVWYMYRITGDTTWQDKGWKMFTSIVNVTSTEFGHSAVNDVTRDVPYQVDEMESFWLAETLKYFYLLFSEPGLVSLDEWVLNTEAHPFKRPT